MFASKLPANVQFRSRPHLALSSLRTRPLSSSSALQFQCKQPSRAVTVDEVLRCTGKNRIYPHKFFYKFLLRDKKINPFFVKPPVAAPVLSYQDAVDSVASSRVADSKRIVRLNKLYMKYIPELITTSEMGLPLSGYNIHITGVKIPFNFGHIRVYWVPTGNIEQDNKIQSLLNDISYPLRRELTNLTLLGLVPPIKFEQDEKYAYLKLMDKLMKIADYGENYVPSFIQENQMRKSLELEITMPKELKEGIIKMESFEVFEETEEKTIPVIRTNVFGLNRDKIMKQILETKKHRKFMEKDVNELSNIVGTGVLKMTFVKAVPIETWDRLAFREFIKKKKMDRKRILKVAKREIADLEKELATKLFKEENEEQTFEDELYNEFVVSEFPDVYEDKSSNTEIQEAQLSRMN